jgi:hypothetical protein
VIEVVSYSYYTRARCSECKANGPTVTTNRADAVEAWNRGSLPPSSPPPPPLEFTYTNWRGVASRRRVYPRGAEFTSTKWHPEAQWMLIAHDLDKDAERTFAIKDIQIDQGA